MSENVQVLDLGGHEVKDVLDQVQLQGAIEQGRLQILVLYVHGNFVVVFCGEQMADGRVERRFQLVLEYPHQVGLEFDQFYVLSDAAEIFEFGDLHDHIIGHFKNELDLELLLVPCLGLGPDGQNEVLSAPPVVVAGLHQFFVGFKLDFMHVRVVV